MEEIKYNLRSYKYGNNALSVDSRLGIEETINWWRLITKNNLILLLKYFSFYFVGLMKNTY